MNTKHLIALFFVLFALGTVSIPKTSFAASGFLSSKETNVIQEIRIKGVERIEPSTVMTYLNLGIGDTMDQESLDRALKNLFSTGLFADVTMRQRSNTLIVELVENPVINQIAFEGNDDLSNDDLKAEIELQPRQVFTRTKVQNDVNRLYQIYQRNGRFSATIEPKVIKLPQNRVNLIFEIAEGEVTKIKSIRFVGNRNYSDSKLRGEVSTKETEWYKFLSSSDRYDPDRVSFDKELLRRFYLSQGYVDFQLISAAAELSQNREFFFLTFTLEEGERYKINDIRIESDLRHFDNESLREFITFEKGDWYNLKEVNTSVDQMTDALGDMQFAFVKIRPDLERNVEDKTVDVIFTIDETPRVFVERIDIKGNVRTQDRVVRREFELVEGDPFNKSKLAKSEQNIKDLDYFETSSVETRQGTAPDKTIIDVEVQEKSTGELSIGAGFSTSDGPLTDLRIRERNFMGKGQDVLLASTIAGERTQFDFSFTEPYFFGRDFSAGADLFHINRDFQDESSFDQTRTGGALRLGYPLSEKWRQTLRYRIEKNEIRDVNPRASIFIKEQQGQRTTSAISQRITYDDRDSKLFPTNGLYSWLSTEYAGLGGNANYVSGTVGSSYYYPIFEKVVLNVLGETGAIRGVFGEDVVINERYFLGGNDVRGFEDSGIGPRDRATKDAVGGNIFYRGTVELSFPVGLPEEMGVEGHTFTDFGSLTGIDDNSTAARIVDVSSIRASAGVGVSWRSPLGPIRLDLAVPYAKQDFDEEELFRFNFGTRF